MGKVSVKKNKNIYQLARESLGYSRATAAEIMAAYGMTEHRLVKIEEESVAIQPADIIAMAKGYQMPELRNHYCTHSCQIGEIDAVEIDSTQNIHEILVKMVVALDSVNQKKIRLMEILSDGKIAKDEVHDFNDIQKELESISSSVEELQLWCEKMKLLIAESK